MLQFHEQLDYCMADKFKDKKGSDTCAGFSELSHKSWFDDKNGLYHREDINCPFDILDI
jgi:hypothetical protein